MTDVLQIYSRVENALDEGYQEVFGYEGVERAVYFGLRVHGLN